MPIDSFWGGRTSGGRDLAITRVGLRSVLCAGILLTAGCGMITVVAEEAPSDYALCLEKREAGGISPEVAAFDCADLADQAGT
ncbi:MAG: hypothetical protein P8M73_09805 [Luminiphilus sp.]|jgi:hypothetical protein|nr:hypothetical protein [Luminiphilus sp.]